MRAGDKAVLSCETDSIPEPAVTWYKDGQPLVLAQRTQTLQGGQKLEILDTQVSDPGAWAAMGSHTVPPSGPGRRLCGGMWGLLPLQPGLIGSLRGWRVGRAHGSTGTHRMTLSRSLLRRLPQFPQDLEAFSRPLTF